MTPSPNWSHSATDPRIGSRQSGDGVTPGWSLRDRSFLSALAFSLLWHCFWFFSVSISVAVKKPAHPRPKIVSLGPVLDDSIFRTLVETRPELSETFYRRLSDFSKQVDLEVKTMERLSPGEVVGLPLGRRMMSSIRSLVGGAKSSPDTEFASRLATGYSQEIEALEGEVRGRAVIDRPEAPHLPAGFEASLGGAGVVLDFIVERDGSVSDVHTAVSSGNRHMDFLWESYLKNWRFEPQEAPLPGVRQKGRIRFRAG